eukprot:2351699-Rhodomonas_salina.2
MDEIEDADVNIVLLGERYGQDLPEDLVAPEATVRPWLNRHHANNRKFGSVLEIAAVYAAFFCGQDASMPAGILPGPESPRNRFSITCTDRACGERIRASPFLHPRSLVHRRSS